MSLKDFQKQAIQKIANKLDELGLSNLADELDLVLADAADKNVAEEFNVGDVSVKILSDYSLNLEQTYSWEASLGKEFSSQDGYSDLEECVLDAISVAKHMESKEHSLETKDHHYWL